MVKTPDKNIITALYLFVREYFNMTSSSIAPVDKTQPHFCMYTMGEQKKDCFNIELEKPTCLSNLDPISWGDWANMSLQNNPLSHGCLFWGVVHLNFPTETPNPHAFLAIYERGKPVICFYSTLGFSEPLKFLPSSYLFPEGCFDFVDHLLEFAPQ